MNTFGNCFRISIFGESHGHCIGCTIDGLPAGFKPDFELMCNELKLRSPRCSIESTARSEADDFDVISGLYNGFCTGMPLTVLIKNTDAQSRFYSTHIARPSHADYSAYKKYNGFNDPRGGGAFSGRLTAPIVFAGALAKQLLSAKGINLFSHIYRIGNACDKPFDPMMTEAPQLNRMFPLIDESVWIDFDHEFQNASSAGTSLGGTVECAILGVPTGIGEPFFNSIESMISHIMFSIPAIHGIEFGAGFGFSQLDGIRANDKILPNGRTTSNHSGGINGGISNGMPIIFRTCFRPIPTIRAKQIALNLETGAMVEFEGNDRHDICILPRGCVVVENAAAIALYDLLKLCERI